MKLRYTIFLIAISHIFYAHDWVWARKKKHDEKPTPAVVSTKRNTKTHFSNLLKASSVVLIGSCSYLAFKIYSGKETSTPAIAPPGPNQGQGQEVQNRAIEEIVNQGQEVQNPAVEAGPNQPQGQEVQNRAIEAEPNEPQGEERQVAWINQHRGIIEKWSREAIEELVDNEGGRVYNELPEDILGTILSYLGYREETDIDTVKCNISLAIELQKNYRYHNSASYKDIHVKNQNKWLICANEANNGYSFYKSSLYVTDDAPLYCLLFLASKFWLQSVPAYYLRMQNELCRQANWSHIGLRGANENMPVARADEGEGYVLTWASKDISCFYKPIKALNTYFCNFGPADLPQAIQATCTLEEGNEGFFTVALHRSTNIP
ncbi:MAG: hypothetical protein AAF380_02820 [Bacteroidota bacterium]